MSSCVKISMLGLSRLLYQEDIALMVPCRIDDGHGIQVLFSGIPFTLNDSWNCAIVGRLLVEWNVVAQRLSCGTDLIDWKKKIGINPVSGLQK